MDQLQEKMEEVGEVRLIHWLISAQQHNAAEDVSVYSICSFFMHFSFMRSIINKRQI